MKKAYVKPVFMAEEFEGLAHVTSTCGYSINDPAEVYDGVGICFKKNGCNHTVDGSGEIDTGMYSNELTYWEYASGAGASNEQGNDAYLFTVGNGQCDFLWNSSNDDMGVWKTPDTYTDGAVRPGLKKGDVVSDFVNWLGIGFSQFFFNNSSSNSAQHQPGYMSQVLLS